LTPYMAKLEPGKDTMLFKGPIPKFKYQPNTSDRGLAIAGGSGITTMWQLINHSLTLPEDKTKWTLLFSNVTEQDICEFQEIIIADDSTSQRVGSASCTAPRASRSSLCARQATQELARSVRKRGKSDVRRDGIHHGFNDIESVPKRPRPCK
ncbi:hypothetical protein CPI04_02480, partial [Moraxella catarrhalis]|nr:hypothetical protein [Moraxella catarrhalis]